MLRFLKAIHADDDGLAALHRLLIGVGGVLDLALNVALLNGGKSAAEGVNALDVLACAAFDFVRQLLDIVASAQRVGLARDATLVSDDLLGTQSQPSRFFGGQSQRLIRAIRMQRLRAA